MASMERTFSLHVPSSTENLALIREFVAAVGVQAGFSPKELGQLELAVDEACANVIEHAYGCDGTKEVTVRAMFDADSLNIEVIDTGKAFDPGMIQQVELGKLVSARKSGGLGMRLMKSFMDEVHYHMIPGEKNELRMVKRLKKG